MGNCLGHKSSTGRDGKDSGFQEVPEKITTKDDLYNKGRKSSEAEKEFVSGDKSKVSSSTEVKLKITKKQLEELLARSGLEDLPLEQVLIHLINASDDFSTQNQPWKPVLQSIPEVN
ncbi:hypothetical protein IFM89_023309 [Coptis chinensis]|uniref:Uncharacterized protein n=1 Tax=Coptis chinensis TaxID=261450 RepID=A0A835LCF5_9MAGN|nr:hypothetical protein IFM89_023309 [Coptis chinensis]